MIRTIVTTLALLILAAPARAALLIEQPSDFNTLTTTNYPDFSNPAGPPRLTGGLIAGNQSVLSPTVQNFGIKFDVNIALPAGATIQSATLSFSVATAFPFRGGIFPTTLAFTATASTTRSVAVGDFVAGTGNAGSVSVPLVDISAPLSVALDVTSTIASIYGQGATSVFFQGDNRGFGSYIYLNPFLIPGPPPTLSIQFTPAGTVPEPASVLLMAGGLALVLARRRTNLPGRQV